MNEEEKNDEKELQGEIIDSQVDQSILALNKIEEPQSLIPDDKILGYFDDAMQCIKEDRFESHDKYIQFCEMIMNEGDPSSATKEAMVNLLKIKQGSIDQMIKILDLWTRLKMKDRSTSSQIYAYQQNNKYEINNDENKVDVKKLLELTKEMRKGKDKNV